MFWATGALSSFLDNTPTYLVFLTTAGTLGFTNGIATTLGTVPVKLLSAISWIYGMVHLFPGTGVHHRYAGILFIREEDQYAG